MTGDDLLEAVLLLDAVPVAAVVVGADRTVRGWNAAAESLYGHRAADAVGVDVVELLFDPDDHETAARRFDPSRGAPWEGDCRVRRSDGALLVSSFRLRPLTSGWAWLATDVLDQGLAEQERSVLQSADHAARALAEEALGLLEAILGAAPVPIAVFDTALRYVRVNEAYAALSGVPAERHAGGRLGEVVDTPVGLVADLRRVVTTGRTILGRPVDLSADGEVRHFSVSFFPVHTGGSLVGAGFVGVEVTQLMRAEAARQASLAEAEAARGRMAIIAAASTVLGTTMQVDEQLTRLARTLVPSAGACSALALFGRGPRPEHLAVAATDPRLAAELEVLVRTSGPAAGSPVAEAMRSGLPRLLDL
ncbi:MAG TPA: PAS domain-containing protein, partial [Acidimicrobiales bacterium]|nr:PAS domain-containing protein [Acidimicrobiales bacterium]